MSDTVASQISSPDARRPSQSPTHPADSAQPAHLFAPLRLRDIALSNRIVVSPMCQYSCEDRTGIANDWHFVHLGSRAVGGAALVFTEAAAVEARGRISPEDLGIWNDVQAEALAPIVRFIAGHGAVPGIQLAHAGRKASVARPWEGGGPLDSAQGGWPVVGPSPVPFADGSPVPHALTRDEIADVVAAFACAAERALAVGFQVVELHAAHGYLLHEFLSPASNLRTDDYGASFEHRVRLVVETVRAIRRIWPERLPLCVRLSATDWIADHSDGAGWTLDQTVALASMLSGEGADVIDCSSGGNLPHVRVPTGPGYQVSFGAEVRRAAGIPTMAVGMITDPVQADTIVRSGQADLVALAREELRDPYWPLHAARTLGHELRPRVPPQYQRAF
jgi:2,4-dienoyl-CoA reductase-like NADH-dependent reductase (Old Yellow Enzyme family)